MNHFLDFGREAVMMGMMKGTEVMMVKEHVYKNNV
jgi:hypothetical protein